MKCPVCSADIALFADKNIKCRSCGSALEAQGQAVLYIGLAVIMLFAKLSILTNAKNIFVALAGMLLVAGIIYIFVRAFFIKYVLVEN